MTKKEITFETLDSWFLNTGNGRLNVGYLNDCIFDMFDITYRQTNAGNGETKLHKVFKNKGRKTSSLVWEAFMEMTNVYIEWMRANRLYCCTSDQLKKYLAQYGYTPETALSQVCKDVEELRREFASEV